MARIRTVKPDLFRHGDLYDAEKKTGLPLRLAFIGLFTICDKEGRFKWSPRTIKLDILPYDDIEMEAILNGLAQSKLIIKYENRNESFGCIPTWSKHQVINSRESDSKIPSLESSMVAVINEKQVHAHVMNTTKQVHANGEGEGKGKGREGEEEEEGKGREGETTLHPKKIIVNDSGVNFYDSQIEGCISVFTHWQKVMGMGSQAIDYPRQTFIQQKLADYSVDQLKQAIDGCARSDFHMGREKGSTSKHNKINLIFRDNEQIDHFISIANQPVSILTTEQQITVDNINAVFDRRRK